MYSTTYVHHYTSAVNLACNMTKMNFTYHFTLVILNLKLQMHLAISSEIFPFTVSIYSIYRKEDYHCLVVPSSEQ